MQVVQHEVDVTAELEGLLEPDDATFLLLDAAREPDVLSAITRSDLPHRSLYRGDTALRLHEVAPYLVELASPDAGLALLRRAWGRAWGIVIQTAEESFDVAHAHLRRFLFVDHADGRSVYFRYYDPRVMRAFLPTCSDEQYAALFAVPTRFIVEGEDGQSAMTFTRRGKPPQVRRHLCIEPAQIRALSQSSEHVFEGRVAKFLGQQFDDALRCSKRELRTFAREQIARGRTFGLRREQHLVTYVVAAWMLGADFADERPAARATLQSNNLTPTWKAKWLTWWTPEQTPQSQRRAAEVTVE